jgi:hypothetical protein
LPDPPHGKHRGSDPTGGYDGIDAYGAHPLFAVRVGSNHRHLYLLTSHEGDQIFLDAAQEHMAREQRELVAKIGSLSRPIKTSGIAAVTLLLVIVGMYLYEGLKSF